MKLCVPEGDESCKVVALCMEEKKHRALLGVWGFVGGSIPEDSISSVYCVWWR